MYVRMLLSCPQAELALGEDYEPRKVLVSRSPVELMMSQRTDHTVQTVFVQIVLVQTVLYRLCSSNSPLQLISSKVPKYERLAKSAHPDVITIVYVSLP